MLTAMLLILNMLLCVWPKSCTLFDQRAARILSAVHQSASCSLDSSLLLFCVYVCSCVQHHPPSLLFPVCLSNVLSSHGLSSTCFLVLYSIFPLLLLLYAYRLDQRWPFWWCFSRGWLIAQPVSVTLWCKHWCPQRERRRWRESGEERCGYVRRAEGLDADRQRRDTGIWSGWEHRWSLLAPHQHVWLLENLWMLLFGLKTDIQMT